MIRFCPYIDSPDVNEISREKRRTQVLQITIAPRGGPQGLFLINMPSALVRKRQRDYSICVSKRNIVLKHFGREGSQRNADLNWLYKTWGRKETLSIRDKMWELT